MLRPAISGKARQQELVKRDSFEIDAIRSEMFF